MNEENTGEGAIGKPPNASRPQNVKMIEMTILSAILGLAVAQGPSVFPEGILDLPNAKGLDGAAVSIDPSQAPATVIFFLNVECPIGNRYAPEMGRIHSEYKKRGAQFYRVYIEPTSRAKLIAKHGQEYRLFMTPLLDPAKGLVKTLGVQVSPEVAVIGKDGTLKYRGRIDDQNIEHGRVRRDYRRDLRIALDEILAGKPVSVRQTPAIGCIIP